MVNKRYLVVKSPYGVNHCELKEVITFYTMEKDEDPYQLLKLENDKDEEYFRSEILENIVGTQTKFENLKARYKVLYENVKSCLVIA